LPNISRNIKLIRIKRVGTKLAKLLENTKIRDHLENTGICERITLKQVLEK
jgi:hypothetical protein